MKGNCLELWGAFLFVWLAVCYTRKRGRAVNLGSVETLAEEPENGHSMPRVQIIVNRIILLLLRYAESWSSLYTFLPFFCSLKEPIACPAPGRRWHCAATPHMRHIVS